MVLLPKEAVEQLAEPLKGVSPDTRWNKTPEDGGRHITLHTWEIRNGKREEELIRAIRAAAAEIPPVLVEVDGVGCFSEEDRVTVVHAVVKLTEELVACHHALSRAVGRIVYAAGRKHLGQLHVALAGRKRPETKKREMLEVLRQEPNFRVETQCSYLRISRQELLETQPSPGKKGKRRTRPISGWEPVGDTIQLKGRRKAA